MIKIRTGKKYNGGYFGVSLFFGESFIFDLTSEHTYKYILTIYLYRRKYDIYFSKGRKWEIKNKKSD